MPNAYQLFNAHATPYLNASRPTWAPSERRYTILVLYYGDARVKQHYRTHNTVIPILHTLFQRAYTRGDWIQAKRHGVLPGALASVHVPAPPPPPNPQPTQVVPALQLPVAPTSDASAPVAAGPSGTPYAFWPVLPWGDEPDLPDAVAGQPGLGQKNTFMETAPHMVDNETDWHGANYLGAGSSGAAGLWCQVDEDYNVTDRMVVKDNAAATREAWRDPRTWRDRLPVELAIHRRIEARRSENADACYSIIRCRGHRLLMSKRRYRLYTDYASGGDMNGAMWSSYHGIWEDIDPDNAATAECLPEAFIWYTIKALATACLLLQNGTTGDDVVKGWRPIMHLDFQYPNILLDIQDKKRKAPADADADAAQPGPSKRPKRGDKAPGGDYVPDYTDKVIVPMLTDFGISTYDLDFSHCPSLDENPMDLLLSYDDFHARYAPEQYNENQDSADLQKLDDKTNIYGIGRIAWALIVNKCEQAGPMREGGAVNPRTGTYYPLSKPCRANTQAVDRYDTQVLTGSRDWPAASRYSNELKDVVRDCLKFYNVQRPSARQVLDRVEKHLFEHPELEIDPMDVVNTGLAMPECDGFEVGELLVVRPPTG